MLKKAIKNIIFVIIVSTLGSCTSLDRLNKTASKGDSFQNYLVEHYRKLAKKEAKNLKWDDYRHFVNKALVATRGVDPFPENLCYWKIPADKMAEFSSARNKLITLLYTHKLKDTHPELSADAQYNFDCWVDEQDKSQNGQCRESFYKSLYELSNLVNPDLNKPAKKIKAKKIVKKPVEKKQVVKKQVVKKTPAKKVKKVEKKETTVAEVKKPAKKTSSKAKKYVISMKNNDAKLDQKHKATLSHIASYLDSNPAYSLNILSYNNNDKIDDAEKMMIAKYRAQIVKDTLKKNGVPNNKITSYAFGALAADQVHHELASYGENVINIVISEQ